jgi:hypothetical protein
MGVWSTEELSRIEKTDELHLASRRDDGSLSRFTTMWVVRIGDDVYVRSAGGPQREWFRRATSSGAGRVRVGGVERDVTFEAFIPEAAEKIDAAYHAKYDRYGLGIVGRVVGTDAVPVTIRLAPDDVTRRR